MEFESQVKNKTNWKKILFGILFLLVLASAVIFAVMFIQEKDKNNKLSQQSQKVLSQQSQKVETKEKTQKAASERQPEVQIKQEIGLIDFGKGGKSLKTSADVDSLQASTKVKEFLKKEVQEANAWNEKVDRENGGKGIKFNPKIYKIHGDYFAYFSGYDTGAGSRIWGPAIGGEKNQTPQGVAYTKAGEIIGLYGLYTKCSEIIKYKIPYDLFTDYELVGGLDLTIEKCAESERRNY